MKSKITAGVLALLLGSFGVHKFYLNRPGQGILYVLFFWTFIPGLIAFIEALFYFFMSEAEFNSKYNSGYALAAPQPQNIVVNVASHANASGGDRISQLKQLHELRTAGALSETEYDAEKRKLLS